MDTDIAGQIVRTFESVVANGEAVQRFAEETEAEIHRLWKDNAELRDELHALANRVETLTRAHLTEPAEVAAKIVTTGGFIRDDRVVPTGEPRVLRGYATEWSECSECGIPIRFTDGLVYDHHGLHTCRASA